MQYCIILYCCLLNLDLLLYVVEDESLRVDDVVGGIEGDGVQRAAVNAASVCWPSTRFGPDQPPNGGNKTLGGTKGMKKGRDTTMKKMTLSLS